MEELSYKVLNCIIKIEKMSTFGAIQSANFNRTFSTRNVWRCCRVQSKLYIYIYNIIYICIDIYNIIYSIYISLNGLASFFSLPRYWLTIMRNWRHSSISTFCASGVATDQICSFNGHDETILFCFVTHICCFWPTVSRYL